MKRIVLFFKMRYVRLIVNISKRASNGNEKVSEMQKSTLNIFFALIRDQEADLLYAPLSEKILIQKGDMFLSITKTSNGCIVNISGTDKVSKTNYHYDIWFNEHYYSKLKSKFTNSIDRRRSSVEAELISRDIKSLEKILNDIKTNNV